jgi:Taurine catabolism dioxygenase TauD, TfdA family
MPAYTASVKNGAFAAHVECDDFLDLARDPNTTAELQALLDRHMVLHISPQTELNHEAVGRFAVSLGMPKDGRPRQPSARPGDGQAVPPPRTPMSAEYPFIGDFSSPARDPVAGERVPSYIESLHYDGISSYSVQATFNTPLTTPNLWSDMRAAYQLLPADLKKVVDRRHALHAFVPPPGTALKDFPALEQERAVRRPLRIKHPRTGEPVLYLPKNPASVIEGLPDDEGIPILHDLWSRVNTSPAHYTARAAHNQMFVWDGLGTTHTNPAYPRNKPRTLWFFIIPGKSQDVEAYVA